MKKKMKKASGWRRKIMAAVFSAAATSAVTYYWHDIVRLAPVVVNKVVNREAAAKKLPQHVPGILTSFQKQD